MKFVYVVCFRKHDIKMFFFEEKNKTKIQGKLCRFLLPVTTSHGNTNNFPILKKLAGDEGENLSPFISFMLPFTKAIEKKERHFNDTYYMFSAATINNSKLCLYITFS